MPAFPWKSYRTPEPTGEYFVLASRLPLRSRWTIPTFLRLTMAVRRQLAESSGLVGYSLLAQPLKGTFWTVSAWEDEERLRTFTRALPHADVMRVLSPHMSATTFVSWSAQGAALPVSWREAHERLEAARAPEALKS